MRPILVLGAPRMLEPAFVTACAARDLALRIVRHTDVDEVAHVLDRERPWVVIDAGGELDIDEAEADPLSCHARHVVAVEARADACAERQIHFVMLSTDQVFDGQKTLPYDEDDAPAPLAVYGRAKLEAERRIARAHADALVLRTGTLFGCPAGTDFVGTTLRTLGRGDLVRVPHDEILSPTYAPDLVDVCLDLAIDRASGVWHLVNQGAVSWQELACAAARGVGHDPARVIGIAARELPGRAPRPAYAALASRRGAVLPDLADALARYHRAPALEDS